MAGSSRQSRSSKRQLQHEDSVARAEPDHARLSIGVDPLDLAKTEGSFIEPCGRLAVPHAKGDVMNAGHGGGGYPKGRPRASARIEAMSETAPDRPSNRLIHSTSPYLLQHAHNPVDWYPWGEEALGRARAEDRPILLSIGYSSCHWCHVMERESFENDAIAALMNRGFVSIKVDREERPDIDDIYMAATLADRKSVV